MSDQNYEEGYFKLKKSNEELTVLINKVLNDFKQTKSQLLSEKDKSSIVTKRNVCLEKQLSEITNKCKDHQQELEDLRDEVASLKTYTKAVEGVAENFCGKNMVAETKYKKLKRKSTILFSQLQVEGALNINFDDTDEYDAEQTSDFANVKKNCDEKLAKEKQKKILLRNEVKELQTELENNKTKMNELILQLEEKSKETEEINLDMTVLSESYAVLKSDNDSMMECFRPFQKMKHENKELKRTSSLLLNEVDINGKMMQFSKILEEMKVENASLNNKIKELESATDSTAFVIKITTLKLKLDETTETLANALKETDTLKHENRILKEQKGGPGIPPPPPSAPPPPPPPIKNPILKLFKRKSNLAVTPKAENLEEKKVADMMKELQKRLEQKVLRERQMTTSESSLNRQETCDVPDSETSKIQRRWRCYSLPNIHPVDKKVSELEEKFRQLGHIREEM